MCSCTIGCWNYVKNEWEKNNLSQFDQLLLPAWLRGDKDDKQDAKNADLAEFALVYRDLYMCIIAIDSVLAFVETIWTLFFLAGRRSLFISSILLSETHPCGSSSSFGQTSLALTSGKGHLRNFAVISRVWHRPSSEIRVMKRITFDKTGLAEYDILEAMKGNIWFPPLLNHFMEGGEFIVTMVSSPLPMVFRGLNDAVY